MKWFLVFLTTVAAVSGYKAGLRVRFSFGLFGYKSGKSYFYDIPKNVTEAENAGWVETERSDDIYTQLVMYCFSETDKVVCALYDDNGFVAGIQIAIPMDNISDSVFDWETQGWTKWNTTINGEVVSHWRIKQYFVDDAYLETNKADRLASYNSSTTLQAGALWTTGFYGSIDKMYTSAADTDNYTLFTKQRCVPWMGVHRYYNMSSTTECTSDKMYPWFLLHEKKTSELVATGLAFYAKVAVSSGERNWYETPGEFGVWWTIPNGPDCLYEIAKSPGVHTMHIYYTDEPWNLSC